MSTQESEPVITDFGQGIEGSEGVMTGGRRRRRSVRKTRGGMKHKSMNGGKRRTGRRRKTRR